MQRFSWEDLAICLTNSGIQLQTQHNAQHDGPMANAGLLQSFCLGWNTSLFRNYFATSVLQHVRYFWTSPCEGV